MAVASAAEVHLNLRPEHTGIEQRKLLYFQVFNVKAICGVY